MMPGTFVGTMALTLVASAACAFEKIALVDSFDFITHYDCETKEGTRKILDEVFSTGADTMLWRHQTGGVLRYPSKEEPLVKLNGCVDKRRVPDSRVFGWARLEQGETNLLAYAIEEAKRRGKGAGIHYTFEENHFATFTFGTWNMEHPQYWVRGFGGNAFPGRCSFAFDEVLAHKMRLLDALLETKPDTLYLEPWRGGGWSPAQEYVEPVVAAWREKYGCEPPRDPRDGRWTQHVSFWMERYVRAIRARIRAHGGRTRFLVGLSDMDLRDRNMWERFALDWKKLAAEGVFDAVVVSNVRPSGDTWKSTRDIYEYVMTHRGKADVYFHCSIYDYHYGIPSYCRATGESREVVARKLLELAKDVGGKGVILECVDQGNYSPSLKEIIRKFK